MRGIGSTIRIWGCVAALLVLGGTGGCQSGAPRRVASTEPGLNTDGTTVAETTPPAANQVSWIDRHPLFYKPREYFDSSGNNTIVKTASATFIGIPAGIVGEVRQVLTGSPNGTRY